MKKIAITLIFLGSIQWANSQSFDKKAVKDELKGYLKDPQAYFNQKNSINAQLSDVQQQLQDSVSRLSDISSQLDEKNKIIDDLKAQNAKLQAVADAPKVTNVSYSNTNSNNNINAGGCNVNSPYRVQIGVFTQFNMTSTLAQPKCITYSNVNGATVYEVAGFNTADEAYTMAQELRRLGINGSFVTKYNNGSRDRSYNYNRETGAADRYPTSGGSSSSASSYAPNAYKAASSGVTYPNNSYNSGYNTTQGSSVQVSTPTQNNPSSTQSKTSGGLQIEE